MSFSRAARGRGVLKFDLTGVTISPRSSCHDIVTLKMMHCTIFSEHESRGVSRGVCQGGRT
jgi:hypothetical protein